ncbi:MAG: heme-binding domain-containing protein [Chitinophagales bacterium]|nr:heme-binding domain-containing protein [Chitinophagaceae bacterium]MCB9065634.1 heme-binding domain-containing protein [Chitinophagales bacterium]
MGKKILWVILAIIVVIQFIRPSKNVSEVPSENDIRVHYAVPSNVLAILKRSCYDCHSNNTNYPWYTNIQPVGWWLNNHIEEGKDELNFSEFATYSTKKAAHKLEEVAELVEENEMPLESYTLMHGDAVLSADEKEMLINWANDLRKSIKQNM